MVRREGWLVLVLCKQFIYCLLYLNYKATTISVWPFSPLALFYFLLLFLVFLFEVSAPKHNLLRPFTSPPFFSPKYEIVPNVFGFLTSLTFYSGISCVLHAPSPVFQAPQLAYGTYLFMCINR